jgi:hypothetical protein
VDSWREQSLDAIATLFANGVLGNEAVLKRCGLGTKFLARQAVCFLRLSAPGNPNILAHAGKIRDFERRTPVPKADSGRRPKSPLFNVFCFKQLRAPR